MQPSLQCVFPQNQQYTYIVDSFKQLPNEEFSGAPDNAFEVQARINISTAAKAEQWLSDMFSQSKCTYRHTRGVGHRVKHKRVVYKVNMHCQHKRKGLTPKQAHRPQKLKSKRPFLEAVRKKKTECPSTLKLTVTVPGKKALNKAHLNSAQISHPTIVSLIFNHNHPVVSAHAFSFRPIASETKEEYYHLFANGHSAASARHAYETRAMLEADDDIMQQLADRAMNPNPQDVSRLYNKWREENLGPENGKEMFDRLDKLVEEYNLKHHDDGGKITVTRFGVTQSDSEAESGSDEEKVLPRRKKLKLQKQRKESPLAVAICTPTMARVHQYVPQAGEMAFIDSTSSLDRYNLSMFLMSTSHAGGGLPLGIMITSDETASTIQQCLVSLQKILPTEAFYKQGPSSGPTIFLSDDSQAQSQALSSTWPTATQLLCVFHMLQSFWTWLHEGKHGIQKEDRKKLMLMVKDLVYAESEHLLNAKYEALSSDGIVCRYPRFLQHLQCYWPRRHKWAVCLRQHLLVRGIHTNNYSEAGIKILKELVFARVKAFNLIEMVSFVIDTMELYYQRRLIHLANNRIDRFISIRFCGMKSSSIPAEAITMGKDLFYVESQQSRGQVYEVDMQLGACSCPRGSDGSPCSHQAAVSKHFHVASINSVPTLFPEKRRELATIALGSKAVCDLSYYSSIHQKNEDLHVGKSQSPHKPSSYKCDVDFSSNAWNLVREGARDETEAVEEFPQGHHSSSEPSSLDEDLTFIFNDMKGRLAKDTSGQMKAAIEKFSERYKAMSIQKFSHSRLASALHRYGWVFGGTVSSKQGGMLRRGRRINVQATAAGRRRKTLSRGKAKAPPGRPAAAESETIRTNGSTLSRYHLPSRNTKPPKRQHSLTANISLSQQNAGKW